MTNLLTAGGAFLSLSALVLVAVSLATNFWVIVPRRADNTPPNALNPIVVNTKLAGLIVRYDLDHLGLWVACYREKDYGGKISCAYVNNGCTANVCWVRNNTDTTCKRAPVSALKVCGAYQALRALTVLGTIFLVIGSALLVVAICVEARTLTAVGAGFTFLGALLLCAAFAVFLKNVFRDAALPDFANEGWSYILTVAAWVVAVFASLLGILGASITGAKDDDIEYESE